MFTRMPVGLVFVLWAVTAAGCGKQGGNEPGPAADPATFPPLPQARALEPGILFHEVTIPSPSSRMKIWIYLPEKPLRTPTPCVFVGPAGSPLFLGMDLGPGDQAEHLPYVRAGFAVVSC